MMTEKNANDLNGQDTKLPSLPRCTIKEAVDFIHTNG